MWILCPGSIPDYAASKRLISITWECPWPLTSFSVDLLVGNFILGGSWLEPVYPGWVSFLWINRVCVSPGLRVWHLLLALNSFMATKGFLQRFNTMPTQSLCTFQPMDNYIFSFSISADLPSCLLIWISTYNFTIKKHVKELCKPFLLSADLVIFMYDDF